MCRLASMKKGLRFKKNIIIAKAFDSAPTYKIKNIKFCVGEIEKATAYDDLGESAIASVEKQIAQESRSEILSQTWKKIVAEEVYGGVE